MVSNNSDAAADYTVSLELNSEVRETRTINVAGNSSQYVSFAARPDAVGIYSVNVNGLAGKVIIDPPQPAPDNPDTNTSEQGEPTGPPVVQPDLSPAKFILSGLTLSPSRVSQGQEVDISVLATNSGESTGDYSVTLKIDGIIVQTRQVRVPGQSNQTINFQVTPDQSGQHQIDINGLPGTLEVSGSAARWLIPTGIALAVVIFSLTFVMILRRSKRSEFH